MDVTFEKSMAGALGSQSINNVQTMGIVKTSWFARGWSCAGIPRERAHLRKSKPPPEDGQTSDFSEPRLFLQRKHFRESANRALVIVL